MPSTAKVVVIVSITSDIGIALAHRYADSGHTIVGTYRSTGLLDQLSGISNLHLFPCDLMKKQDIASFVKDFEALGLKWDTFISLPCTPLPLKAFFDCDFDEWSESVHLNAIEQLRILHKLHPFRNNARISDVVLFAGGGINNAVIDFSAYTISKIMLIKMCEFLDAENKDLNIFIVGPGWTRTKAHYITLANVGRDSIKYKETAEFMSEDKGTSMDDIFGCVQWLCRQGKDIASGRNFSVVNDQWHGEKSDLLAQELKRDPNIYKLRRFKNDLLT
jgi:short-subunit dehydrogenase